MQTVDFKQIINLSQCSKFYIKDSKQEVIIQTIFEWLHKVLPPILQSLDLVGYIN